MDSTIKALFTPPFKVDPYSPESYIWDSAHNMVASNFNHDGKPDFGPRGHGRHKYLKGYPKLHDDWCEFYINLTKGITDDPQKIVDLLNQTWSE